VDFLHQFCRPVVPKKDKTLPRSRSGRRLRAVTVFAEVFSAQRASALGEKMRWI
jgi:hypothetical protein